VRYVSFGTYRQAAGSLGDASVFCRLASKLRHSAAHQTKPTVRQGPFDCCLLVPQSSSSTLYFSSVLHYGSTIASHLLRSTVVLLPKTKMDSLIGSSASPQTFRSVEQIKALQSYAQSHKGLAHKAKDMRILIGRHQAGIQWAKQQKEQWLVG